MGAGPRVPCGRRRTVAGLCVMFRGKSKGGPRPSGRLRTATSPGRAPMTSTQDGQATADLKPTLDALVAKHAERLDAALAAIAARDYWSAYPATPGPPVYRRGSAE